jgi:hypothetical protein
MPHHRIDAWRLAWLARNESWRWMTARSDALGGYFVFQKVKK